MTEPANPYASTWNSPEMAKRLQRRYAAERRFKAIGAGAVALSLSFLAFLLFIMLRDGLGGIDWSFLTGPRSALHGFARDGVKLDVFETPKGQPAPDGPFMHSGRFFLVDGQARVRGYYDSGDEDDMKRLLDDLRVVAR